MTTHARLARTIGRPVTAAGYSALVLADSPAAYYRLGEPSGTTMEDASPNNRDGTYAGVALGTTSLLVSDADTAATFDGGNGDLGWVAAAAWQVPADFTIEARIKPAAVSSGPYNILSVYGGAFAGSAFGFWILSSKIQLQTLTGGAGSSVDSTGTTTLVVGTTYTVTCTYNGTTRVSRVFVNGVQEGTTPTLGAAINAGGTFNLSVGARNSGSGTPNASIQVFNGVLDEVSLTPSILSDARILARHAAAIA